MERVSYLIAISNGSVEGGKIAGGEGGAAFSQSVEDSSNHTPTAQHAREMLDAFLNKADWGRGLAVLVLPTEIISFRRLEFSFSDKKKIRQILPFELENELLDDLGEYAYDFEIVPRANGATEALVYLVNREYLQGLLDSCESHQLSLHRVTFSAQALLSSRSASEGPSFLLYSGGDESFIAYSEKGRLRAVHCLGAAPHRVLQPEAGAQPLSPAEALQSIVQGEEENGEPSPRARELPQELTKELEGVRDEANRFLRIYKPSEPIAFLTDGMFGRFFQLQPDSGDVSLVLEPGHNGYGNQDSLAGVFVRLAENPGSLTGGAGINFFRRTGTWTTLISEFKGKLITSVSLAILLLALGGWNFHAGTSARQEQLDRIDADLRRALQISTPINSITVNAALAKLEDRYAKLKKDQEAIAYLDEYHYDILKLVREISNVFKALPNLSLEALTFNRERFTISGGTVNYNDSETLKNRVSGLPQFKGRTIKISHSRTARGILYRLTIDR